MDNPSPNPRPPRAHLKEYQQGRGLSQRSWYICTVCGRKLNLQVSGIEAKTPAYYSFSWTLCQCVPFQWRLDWISTPKYFDESSTSKICTLSQHLYLTGERDLVFLRMLHFWGWNSIWVYSVCYCLSVPLLRVIMVCHRHDLLSERLCEQQKSLPHFSTWPIFQLLK